MAAGQWNLQLDPLTPKTVRDLLDYFGHVYVFDSNMRAGIGDAAMIAASRWAGVVRRRQTPWEVSGANMISWLGDEDGKGPVIETAQTGTAASFATFVGLLLPAAVSSGSLGTVSGTLTNTYQWVTPRQAIDHLCAYFGAEYRVNKDASFDAGVSSYLFKTTPTAIVMRRSSGRDISIVGLSATKLDVSLDAEEYFTRALIKDASSAYSGATGTATTYKDLKGNLVSLTKIFSSSLTPTASAATLATNTVANGPLVRQEIALSSDEYDLPRDVVAGDYIYVFDPEANLIDSTRQVRYRGSTIYPVVVRVMAITWPIERGMGVWYRDKNGAWTDLTPYVAWEAPGAVFEVGSASRALLSSGGGSSIPLNTPPVVGVIKIAEQVVSAAGNVTFSGIASIYKHLQLIWHGRSDQVGAQVLYVQFNGDAGANYDFAGVSMTNATPGGFNSIAANQTRIGVLAPSGAAAGAQGDGEATIMDYNAVSRRGYVWRSGRFDTDAAANANFEAGHGQWRDTTTAINSIKVIPGAGAITGTFSLYGIP